MKIFKQNEINGIECSIHGYPAYINGVLYNLQYGMNGFVTLHHQDETFITYKIDTDGGQSDRVYAIIPNKKISTSQ
jgi:hypothetical protein